MSKVLRIAEELRQTLLSEGLKADEPAPSIRQVAERYSVSLMTASRILEQLVTEDFLYRIPNRGTFVKHNPPRQPKIGYVGDVPAQGHSEDVLRTCAYDRLQSFLDAEGIVPRYVSYAELRTSRSCLDGLDGIVIASSHVDERTLPLLWTFPGKIVVVGGIQVCEDLCCSAVVPDWEPAFREAFKPDFLSRFQRVLLVGAGHPNAVYLDKLMRRYLSRLRGHRLEVQTTTIQATNFEASMRAFHCFQELKGTLGKGDLIVSFSDFLSMGIREALLGWEVVPVLVSFDNMETYQQREGVLSSIDWRLPDSYAEGARLLLQMLREEDSRNYVIKLPCRFVSREADLVARACSAC